MTTADQLQPGQRVRIHQKIDRREGDWRCAVEGVVRKVEVAKTGSWHAHGKDGCFWLQRIQIEKPDGELTTLNVDELTRIERLDGESAG